MQFKTCTECWISNSRPGIVAYSAPLSPLDNKKPRPTFKVRSWVEYQNRLETIKNGCGKFINDVITRNPSITSLKFWQFPDSFALLLIYSTFVSPATHSWIKFRWLNCDTHPSEWFWSFMAHVKSPIANGFYRVFFIAPECDWIGSNVSSVCHLCEC